MFNQYEIVGDRKNFFFNVSINTEIWLSHKVQLNSKLTNNNENLRSCSKSQFFLH